MWSSADGGAAYVGAPLRLGFPFGRRCQADAVFEVWEEEVHVAGAAAQQAAGVFGVGKIAAIRSRLRQYGCLTLSAHG